MNKLLDVSDLHKSFTVSAGFFRTRRHGLTLDTGRKLFFRSWHFCPL